MPRIKKKTPLSPVEETSLSCPPYVPSSEPEEQVSKIKKQIFPKTPFLTVEEKRKWLAGILRDTSGQHQGYELGLGDKFKALSEDNKLAGHPEPIQISPEEKTDRDSGRGLQDLLQALLATVRPPHHQRFKDKP